MFVSAEFIFIFCRQSPLELNLALILSSGASSSLASTWWASLLYSSSASPSSWLTHSLFWDTSLPPSVIFARQATTGTSSTLSSLASSFSTASSSWSSSFVASAAARSADVRRRRAWQVVQCLNKMWMLFRHLHPLLKKQILNHFSENDFPELYFFRCLQIDDLLVDVHKIY